MKSIRVILFDDNPGVRDSISMLLGSIPGIEFGGSFSDCIQLMDKIEKTRPDVILMDIDMPGVDGIQAVQQLHRNFPEIKILMQTVFDDNDRIFESIRSGAHGYLLKNTPPLKIIESVLDVYHGGAPMTPSIASKVLNLLSRIDPTTSEKSNSEFRLTSREKEVLSLLVQGKAYKMIASDLNITYDTVRAHIKKIYEKLHVSSMTEAVSKAIYHKII